MFVRSQLLRIAPELQDALLATLLTIPGAALLTTPKVVLWTGAYIPADGMSMDDLPPPTFSGYVPVLLGALSAPVNFSGGRRAIHKEVNWIATDPDPDPFIAGDAVTGYAITDTTLAILYAAERFEAPFLPDEPGDFLSLDVMIAMAAIFDARNP